MPEQKSSYIISIIIPVYNKEKSLRHCFDSLANQDRIPFEIILVNDGSTDGSCSICEEYAASRPNVRLITQSNRGVSSARNAGIRVAHGDYLLFLDADDTLAPHSVSALRKFIGAHGDDVDVISYRIEYIDPRNRKTSVHPRERWLKQDGVYSLRDYPYIAQTTMNVCVRNCFGIEGTLFPEDMRMGEDQLFITRHLERKGVIGYCRNATYRYTRDGSGASVRSNNPLDAYDDMLALFNEFVSIGNQSEDIGSYAFQMLLYNISWRIKSDMLFPVHAKGEAYVEAEQPLRHIMNRVPVREIVASPYLNEHHKGFLLRYFHLITSSPTVTFWPEWSDKHSKTPPRERDSDLEGKTRIKLEGDVDWFVPKTRLLITKCMKRPDGVHVEGRILSPAFAFLPKPELICRCSGKGDYSVPLSSSGFDYCAARIKTTTCWTFRFVIQSEDSLRYTFVLVTSAGQTTELDFKFKSGLLRFNARREHKNLYFPGQVLKVRGNTILLRKKHLLDCFEAGCLGLFRDPLTPIRRLSVRLFRLSLHGSSVWLYSDLPTSSLESNAFIQFKHDMKSNDAIIRYYVTKNVADFVSRHPEYSNNVLQYGSKKHFLYSICASVLLASYLERYTYMPYRKKTYSGVADLTRNQWMIYLQHGVLHAHLPWYYSLDRIAFDKEVVSTSFEISNLLANYSFTKEALITSGMPRFDTILRSHNKPRRIIYVPSWRNYLVSGNGKKRVPVDERFLSSSFYLGFKDLLNSAELNELLYRSGYSLDVKLHPNFSCYNHLLNFASDRIHLTSSNIDENDYAIAITDFSSYVFDFVYSGCDILYFMPDRLEFDAGLNQYRELDLPLEDAFGPYCSTPEEVITGLLRLIEHRDGKRDEELDAYRRRADSFFLHTDGHNSQRLYHELTQLTRVGMDSMKTAVRFDSGDK